MNSKTFLFLVLAIYFFSSCESEQAKKERLAHEEQQKIDDEKIEAAQLEFDRFKRELQAEKERKENNSLPTGATPYSQHYGGNPLCNNSGCSELKVTTSNSDVLVTIKKNGKVVRHAFIKSGESYTFSFTNGIYQPFFYYGKGWDPDKEMRNGEIKGGFISKESFGKDEPQSLNNNILSYELRLQKNGNFSTSPSNPEEAL